MNDPARRLYMQVLVVRCQLGDPSAFAELVGEVQPNLRAYLGKMLPAHVGLDDVAQEVWLAVFRDLGQLLDPTAFTCWLYRIAHNCAYRVMRHRHIETRPIHELEQSERVDDEPAFCAEDAAAVHAALDRLPADYREVLLLRFIEEMSYEAIARVVDSPLGTVRSRIHYAKRALREILAEVSVL